MQIAQYLTKLFDNAADLKFQENIGEYINITLGKYKPEKKHVLFHDNCRSNDQIC